jgi:hypothetical protein
MKSKKTSISEDYLTFNGLRSIMSQEIEMFIGQFDCGSVRVWNLVSTSKERAQAEDVWEHGMEKESPEPREMRRN